MFGKGRRSITTSRASWGTGTLAPSDATYPHNGANEAWQQIDLPREYRPVH